MKTLSVGFVAVLPVGLWGILACQLSPPSRSETLAATPREPETERYGVLAPIADYPL